MATRQVRRAGLPFINVVTMKGVPILQQLEMEECLLRTSSDNWCFINDGTDKPNIVMGVSGKPAELVEISLVLEDKIPVIRRFTGGGTVIVDHGTIFVSFICNKDAVPDVQPYPRPIMSWSSLIYSQVFQGIADVRMIMYSVSVSLVEMHNQLLKIDGSIIHPFCGITRLVTCPISSILRRSQNIDWQGIISILSVQ